MCYKHCVYSLFIMTFLIFEGGIFFTNSFMNKENIYKVYGHLNVTNGKWYIGSTKLNPKERWHSGWGYKNNSKMWKDIQNSDWNNDWIHTVFDTFSNKYEALKYESFLITMLDSVENGYNTSSYSGGTYKRSEETKRKMSESHGVKGVLQFSKNGELITEYPSIMEASRQTTCNAPHICDCCKGERKSVGGYIWRYKE